MAENRMALLEMLRRATAAGDRDSLREGIRVLDEAVMESEVSELTGLPKASGTPSAASRTAMGAATGDGSTASARSTTRGA